MIWTRQYIVHIPSRDGREKGKGDLCRMISSKPTKVSLRFSEKQNARNEPQNSSYVVQQSF